MKLIRKKKLKEAEKERNVMLKLYNRYTTVIKYILYKFLYEINEDN